MSLKKGADGQANQYYPYQHFNRIKDHWRRSDPVSFYTDAVPGMIMSDADDEKLWHITDDSLGADEILQENESYDAEPVFAALQLDVIETGAISAPPTDGELDALFGFTPAQVGAGWHKFVRDISSGTQHNYLVWSNGAEWLYIEGTVAA